MTHMICHPCGIAFSRVPTAHDSIITMNPGRCDWCGEKTHVTDPSDYGYPILPSEDDQNFTRGDMLDD